MAKSKKGGGFERKMCKRLSLWYSHGERDDIFWRTAGSGARATCRMKQGLMTADSAGDMCAIHESAKRLTAKSIWEFKRGYTSKKGTTGSINIISIVDKLTAEKDPILVNWFIKLKKEMRQHGRKYGFIIFQRDRKNACIAITNKTFNYLRARNKRKYFFPSFGPVVSILCYKIEFSIMDLEDFLEWCEPETISRTIRRRMKGLPYEQNPTIKEHEPEYDPSKFKVVTSKTKFERFLSVPRMHKRASSRNTGRIITRRTRKK